MGVMFDSTADCTKALPTLGSMAFLELSSATPDKCIIYRVMYRVLNGGKVVCLLGGYAQLVNNPVDNPTVIL